MKEACLNVATWMNSRTIMLIEKSKSQKSTSSMIPFYKVQKQEEINNIV